MVQLYGFLGRFFGPLLKTGLPLMKNVTKPLAKNVLIPLGLNEVASAADAAIRAGTHVISNDEIDDIIRIVKSLKDSSLL